MTPDYDYGVQTSNNCNNVVAFSILCWYYVKNIIKKTGNAFTVSYDFI